MIDYRKKDESRKRPYRVQVWLSPFEYQRLNVMVACTSLSREQVLRNMINGLELKEAPQLEFYEILDALNRAGNNINQIAVTLHANGFLDEPKLNEALKLLRDMKQQIYDGFKVE